MLEMNQLPRVREMYVYCRETGDDGRDEGSSL
jgi:hypothetical protein